MAEIKIPKAQFMALSDEDKFKAIQFLADELVRIADEHSLALNKMTEQLRKLFPDGS